MDLQTLFARAVDTRLMKAMWTRDVAPMWIFYTADVLITTVIIFMELMYVLNKITTDDKNGLRYHNHLIGTIIAVMHSVALVSGFFAGAYFGWIAYDNKKKNQPHEEGTGHQSCHHTTDKLAYLDQKGRLKLAGIVVAAISYLFIPYLMAMAQAHVWMVGIAMYTDQSILDSVKSINALTYVVFALRVLERVLGHAWAVSRTRRLSSKTGSEIAPLAP